MPSETTVRKRLRLRRKRRDAFRKVATAALKAVRTMNKRIRGDKKLLAPKGRGQAVAWWKDNLYETESPPGSNRGTKISQWQKRLGAWLVGQAWCGVFCAMGLIAAGVKGVGYRLAFVAFIEDDARAGRALFCGWITDRSKVRPGDLAVIGGRGVHVEGVRFIQGTNTGTYGGNTSAGMSGSQSNGGGSFPRVRGSGEVHGYALVRYDD